MADDAHDTRRKRALLYGGTGLAMFAVFGLIAAVRLRSLDKVIEDLGNLPERVAAQIGPARQGEVLVPDGAQRAALQALAKRLDGRIVWASNHDGNHEIYQLELATLEIRRLTNHPNVDTFARFSPDGTRIVFMRSRPEYASVRQALRWDVWLMNADGTDQRRLARRGFYPRWSADGTSVVFGRGQQVIRVDVESGRESVVYDNSGDAPEIRRGDVALSTDGTQLALVLEGGGGVIRDLAANATAPLRGAGVCQPTWAPQDAFITYIESAGHGGTRVMRAQDNGRQPTVFMDLPGDYSHEYFPQLSNDGAWLIWGAAADGHEHDRADYEIFVWQVGEPWESATRITYYTGNDMWPDLFVDDVDDALAR